MNRQEISCLADYQLFKAGPAQLSRLVSKKERNLRT